MCILDQWTSYTNNINYLYCYPIERPNNNSNKIKLFIIWLIGNNHRVIPLWTNSIVYSSVDIGADNFRIGIRNVMHPNSSGVKFC